MANILHSNKKLWVLFFIYPFLVALFVQLILLPYVFPAWHAGDGMLTGGDWYRLHLYAVELSEEINNIGWSAWELRPNGQAPSGIAAFFYTLITPHPWIVIPLQASLHATSTLVLFLLMNCLTTKKKYAFLSILPFWLYPSAMIWYTQNHKDGYMISGAFLILYFWNNSLNVDIWKWKNLDKIIIKMIIPLVAGAFLAWLVRPYSVQMMQAVSVITACFLTSIMIIRITKDGGDYKRILLLIGVVWGSLALLSLFTSGGIEIELQVENSTSEMDSSWYLSGWPTFMEEKAHAMANVRDRYIAKDGKSNIATQVSFRRINDLIFFVPKALQISLFSPFPLEWFKDGTFPSTTLMRRISGMEMIGVYIGLVFLPCSINRRKKHVELWIILIFCFGMLLIYGLVIVNVGTLYRFRYGFLMPLVSLGALEIIDLFREVSRSKKSKKSSIKHLQA